LTHMSNVLGTVTPIKQVIEIAHARGIPVLIDGSQGAVHTKVDVQDLDADFYVMTGHKLYGPTGIGVLYGKYDLLAEMQPLLGAALNYMSDLGRGAIASHEAEIAAYASERLSRINSLRMIGTAPGKGGIFSFEIKGAHAHDVSTILDRYGIAVRAGTHCAQPLLKRFGVTSTCRASFALYNGKDDVDALVDGIERAQKFFA